MALTTDVAIKRWKPDLDGRAISTGGRNGLYIRGWMTGAKAFYFRSKTWIKIGDYPTLSLGSAREMSLVAQRLSKEGYGKEALQRGFAHAASPSELEAIIKGVRLAGVVGTAAPTYDEMFADWFAGVERTLQEGPSRRRPRAIHELHISPHIGDRPIAEVRRREVFGVLASLFQEKPVTAGHALGHLNKVFERAINMELAEVNPVPPRSAFPRAAAKKKHHGTLSPERMPELWKWLQERSASKSAVLAILTAMCTGHRIGVIVNAEWKRIDEGSGTWTVPAREDKATPGRMKSGREFSLVLPSGLHQRLRDLRKNGDQRYVFESPTTSGPISPNAILKLLKNFDSGLTAHGFRNAIKMWCRTAEPPVPDHIADAFCDHSLRGLDASYRRGDTLKERSDVASRLYAYVCEPDTGVTHAHVPS